jgi:hypothetical protein
MDKRAFLCFIILASAIAGCNAGNPGSTPSVTTATPSASASSSASASPTASASSAATFPCNTTTASSSATMSNVTPGTAATYPPLGSCHGSITFSSGTTIAAGTTVNVVTSLAAPTYAPSPLPTDPSGSATPKTIVFETLTVTAGSIALATGAGQAPAQTMTLASAGTCSTYYEAFAAAGGQWQGGYGNAGTLSGTTVTFAAGNGNGGALNAAGSPYYVVFVCF